MKNFSFRLTIFVLLVLAATCIHVEAKVCMPSGKIKGKNPPKDKCNRENDFDCCVERELYRTYKCSPRVIRHTKAVLTLNSFEWGTDGSGLSESDEKFHSDDQKIPALSTEWFNKGKGASTISLLRGNRRSVVATVVDECDSTMGCDDDHDYQLPCVNNFVDASKAVWKALEVPKKHRGHLDITWSDA